MPINPVPAIMSGPEFRRRLQALGLSRAEFAQLTGFHVNTVYGWSRRGPIKSGARSLELLEAVERLRLTTFGPAPPKHNPRKIKADKDAEPDPTQEY